MSAKTYKQLTFELLRFARGSVCVLAVKVMLVAIFVKIVAAPIAYFFTHIIIFFVSYCIHSKWTFKEELNLNNLKKFFFAVALIKLLDWSIFSVLFVYFQANEIVLVITTTAIIALVRFAAIRSALSSSKSP